MHPDQFHRKRLLASLLSTVFIAACGGGENSSTALTPDSQQHADGASTAAAPPSEHEIAVEGVAVDAVAQKLLLGTTTIQPSVDSNTAGVGEAFVVKASANGTSSAIRVYLDASSTARRVI